MSVQAIGWVLDECTERGAERLVLLSIANHADNHGSNSWPSIETIAREAALGETRTKQAIRSLVNSGVLRVEPNAGGSRDVRADRRPNRYTILPLAENVDNSPSRNEGHEDHTTDPRPRGAPGSRGSQDEGRGGHTGDQEPSPPRPDPDSPPPDDFTIAALRAFAARTTKNEGTRTSIRHPRRYERKVFGEAMRDGELMAELRSLHADYPTLTATNLGHVLAGERSILNAHRREA